MSKENSNKPAFPLDGPDGEIAIQNNDIGLTKREYIATQILAGICANTDLGVVTKNGSTLTAISLADQLLKNLENKD